MAKKDENGNWIDPRGDTVPPKFIKQVDRMCDKTVAKIHKKVNDLEEAMLAVKTWCMETLQAYLDWEEKELKAKREGKGNINLTSFSGDLRVEIRVNDIIEFDQRLGLAKSKINECVAKWTENSDNDINVQKLAVVVKKAFCVDKAGAVNRAMVIGLLKYDFKDPLWEAAMDLIRQSQRIVGTKQYLQLSRKTKTESGAEQWQAINLNFSAM